MRRISVVGTSGSGKSTFAAALADQLEYPCIELDAIFHQPDWTPLSDAVFVDRVDAATDGDTWVVDGNYRVVTRQGPVWQRADTVIWLDPPDHMIMFQVTKRTLRRVLRREELWNGNRERLRNVFSRDPSKSIIRWAWTTRNHNREKYETAMADPEYAHLRFIRLTSHREIDQFLEAPR